MKPVDLPLQRATTLICYVLLLPRSHIEYTHLCMPLLLKILYLLLNSFKFLVHKKMASVSDILS